MATRPQTGLTYKDLQSFPEDNFRRELIDGELIVTTAPATRHQRVVVRLVVKLAEYSDARGGEVLPAPTDVYFSETNVVEPDCPLRRAGEPEQDREKIHPRLRSW